MMHRTATDIFFDLDHTLWDFEKNSALTFGNILKKNNINIPLSEFLEVYRPFNLHYWKLYREEKITQEKLRHGRLKSTFDALSYAVEDAVIHVLSEEYIAQLPTHGHLFDDTVAVLNYLKPRYKLHIITNGFKEVQHKKLERANIQHYFRHIVNSETVGVKKPDPRIFEHALEKASVHPRKAVMIGDSLEADILGARNVGMETIHVNHDEEEHDHGISIRKLSEIKQYL
ncbi:MAG: YjjG family noncanonical pyrimidine nucleotidase [Sinomicrobium sp.]|nr:YjjG family noncanonical pyrimidine nucleotidase [Sinomicrobium sp.]